MQSFSWFLPLLHRCGPFAWETWYTQWFSARTWSWDATKVSRKVPKLKWKYVESLKIVSNGPQIQQHGKTLPIIKDLDILVPTDSWQAKSQTKIRKRVNSDQIKEQSEYKEKQNHFRGTQHACVLGLDFRKLPDGELLLDELQLLHFRRFLDFDSKVYQINVLFINRNIFFLTDR